MLSVIQHHRKSAGIAGTNPYNLYYSNPPLISLPLLQFYTKMAFRQENPD